MHRFQLIFLWISLIMLSQTLWAQSLSDAVFDTDFESGFAGDFHFDAIHDTWILELGADNGNASLPASYRRTFYFRVSQAAGIHLKIDVENVYWNCGNVPLISYDRQTWYRLDPATSNDTHIDINVPDDQDQIFISYAYPYTVTDKNQFLQTLEGDGRVTLSVIGQANDTGNTPLWARTIDLVTIQALNNTSEEKIKVWIHARIHPGEVPPSFIVEGLITFLLQSYTLEANWLLEHCICYIVPMMNPTGVYHGNYRTNASSENLEAVWCKSTELGEQSPYSEVDALKKTLDLINSGRTPVAIALNLHATMTQVDEGHFHFKHIYPSVSLAMEQKEEYWITRFDEAATQFNNVNPHTSQLSSCAFVESYLWNHYQDQVMAITMESVYANRDSDDGIALPADFRELGAEMGKALYQYFNSSCANFPLSPAGTETLVLTAGKYPTALSVTTNSGTVERELAAHASSRIELPLQKNDHIRIQSNHNVHAYVTRGMQSESLSILKRETELQDKVILPHIPANDWTATLLATNHSDYEASFEILPQGDETQKTQFTVQAGEGLSLDPSILGTDWLSLQSDQKVWTWRLLFSRADRVTASLNLEEQKDTTVFFPHLPADKINFWFGFVLVNTTDENETYTMTAYNEEGVSLGTHQGTLTALQRKVALLSDEWPDLQPSASWIKITCQIPLPGLMLFGTQNGQSLAGLPLSGKAQCHSLFPVIVQGQNFWQGIAVLNPGDKDSELTLTLYSPDGANLGTKELSLNAGARLVTTLEHLVSFPAEELSSIRIDSSTPLIALELLGDINFTKLDGFLLEPLENTARQVQKKKITLSREELEL
jgi:hypothetical protein